MFRMPLSLLSSLSGTSLVRSLGEHIPVVASALPLLYALSVSVFLAGWREASVLNALFGGGSRRTHVTLAALATFGAALAVTTMTTTSHQRQHRGDDTIPYIRWLWNVAFVAAAWRHIRQVRIQFVVGGPAPLPCVLTELDGMKGKKDEGGKVIVITGCNQGIGKETLRLLFPSPPPTTAAASSRPPHSPAIHTIIMCCRNVEKARQAAIDVGLLTPNSDETNNTKGSTHANGLPSSQNGTHRHQPASCHPNVKVELVEMDLSNFDQVRSAARQIRSAHPRVHVLVNNAGLMMNHHVFVESHPLGDGGGHDGVSSASATQNHSPYELVMTANHLGHFLFTRLLRPTECIINVSSCTYALSNPTFVDDLFCTAGTRRYTMFGQYAASKAANLLFTSELSRRVVKDRPKDDRRPERPATANGASIHEDNKQHFYPACHAVHPGMVRTDVVRNMHWYLRIPNDALGFIVSPFQKTPIQGAWNTIHAINETYRPSRTREQARSWTYWVNRQPSDVLPWIRDEALANRLWEMSSDLVGLPHGYYNDVDDKASDHVGTRRLCK